MLAKAKLLAGKDKTRRKLGVYAANAPLDFEITVKRYARLLVQNDSTAADAIEAGLGAR